MAELRLTAEQRAVVEDRGGSLLVSAAAGSGKTKVLVERLFRYITEEGADVDDFLIITYTRAAAAELRGKIAGELSKRLAEHPEDRHLRAQLLRVYQADIRTVDAFCTGLLRENAHLLAREEDDRGLSPDFRVLDEDEAKLLRERVLDRTLEAFYGELDQGGRALADTLGFGRDDRALVSLVLELYEKVQSHAWRSDWLAENGRRWAAMAAGGGDFDATPYARTLLEGVVRRSGHWAGLLASAAERVEGDADLSAGYGERFLTAAMGFRRLSEAADWAGARRALAGVVFPRLATPKGRKDDPDALAMKKLWEGAKEEVKRLNGLLNITGEEAMEDLAAAAPAMEALVGLTAAFARDYRREKLRRNVADFSDQEHLALSILTERDGTPKPLGRQVASRYREILVDEYQDTNEVQNAIFRAVSREGKNLFTVGDVKQSIYRFRLADPTIFLEKYARFKLWTEAGDGEERKILLSRNFRSRQEVLDGTNFIFSNILSKEMGEMVYGDGEALHYGASYDPDRKDCAVEFHLIQARQRQTEDRRPVKRLTAEARFTADRVSRLLDEGFPVTEADGSLRPCRPEDIVILMRSPGDRAAAYAAALSERGIPCSVRENGDFFETMEISTMLSLLEIIDNPRQDVPLIAVLRSPVFGFTPDRLASIRGGSREGDFFAAVEADGGADSAAFLTTLSELRLLARDITVQQLLWKIYNTLNVLGIFGAMDHGGQRRKNLVTLTAMAEKLENGGCRGLFSFITQLRRLIQTGRAPQAGGVEETGGVRIMSVHKSKGLEFPVVILADLDHSFSVQDFQTPVLVHPTLGLGPARVDLNRKIRYPTLARKAVEETLARENKAEEQRLLYVAMTRAKEKLILVCAMYYSETRLKRLAPQAVCPARPETVAAGRSFADWVLLPLLCRPEAAPLRELADGAVGELYTKGGDASWQVSVHDAADYAAPPYRETEAAGAGGREVGFDRELLEFVYPHQAETELPAKLTATQLKGREMDQEIAEEAAVPPVLRPLTRPKFRQESAGLTAAESGTATHLVLQYLDFSNLDVAGQVAELRVRRLLTEEQAASVRTAELRRFLCSGLAEELRRSPSILREYPFTVLIDAQEVDPAASAGDRILLQGIVDCCFVRPDGTLAVVDFKTDRVSGGALEKRAESYRPQLTAYSAALERVLEKPVTRRVLYFLHAGTAVEVG